jgi:Kef-type K+ transport system membrane component KefB
VKKYRKILFYLGISCIAILVIYLILHLGHTLESGRNVLPVSVKGLWSAVFTSLVSNLEHPVTILLCQIVVIILAAGVFGWICRKIRQPVVIGEIIAGIVLGPSVLGYYLPGFSGFLFPESSLGNLHLLSQVGLVLFMFMIGMELDFSLLKKKVTDAIVISHTGIALSFALGIVLAYFIYESFAPRGIGFLSFSLFVGISLSITAFPVLARIIQERGIHKTHLGNFAISCAAVDDITAWSMLAVVIAIVKAGSVLSSIPTIILSLGYVIVMLRVVQPFLARLGELHNTRENLTKPVVAVFFLILMVSAYATEAIGIHAIFGGFMAGVIMPDNIKFRSIFIEKVEDVSMVLLLPLFFVYTGLRTHIGLLNDPGLWTICLIIILTAISGKFAGAFLASRFTGHGWRESLSLGALMNSRGLVELVVLNIGFDLGVFTPQLFAMLVIMALVTTFMTAPVLELINRLFRYHVEIPIKEAGLPDNYNILLSFGNPDRGRSLLRLSNSFIKHLNNKASITALHLSPGSDLFPSSVDEYEKEGFIPIIEESQNLNQEFRTMFKISTDIESDITDVANKGDFDLLLIGVGRSVFEGSMLGKVLGFTSRLINPAKLFYRVTGKEQPHYSSTFDERTRIILSKTDIPTGIFIDKNFIKAGIVFVFLTGRNDHFLIRYASMFMAATSSSLLFFDPTDSFGDNHLIIREKEAARHKGLPIPLVLGNNEMDIPLLKNADLVLISAEAWSGLVEQQPEWLYDIPSTLILTA